MALILLVAAVLLLAWSNGANDNFKGVATLYGCGAAGYRTALVWATAATVLGSLVSVAFAGALARAFSGAGLVPDDLLGTQALTSIGGAAALTILLATRLGMPTSTTHALTGALLGCAAAAAGFGGVDWSLVAGKFAQPLLLSPVLAVAGTAVVYPLLRRLRRAAGVDRETCLCVRTESGRLVPLPASDGIALAAPAAGLEVEIADRAECVERYEGRLLGIEAQATVDTVHYLSGGAVCFARAVNDTPKIAALLLAAGPFLGSGLSSRALLLVALAMAAGGWLQSRRVAETMSRRITDLNPGQGLTANLVTAALVLGASRLGVPVSTTHVSCGSIFGIGLANRRGDPTVITQILATWVTTLPLGAALGALFYRGSVLLGG